MGMGPLVPTGVGEGPGVAVMMRTRTVSSWPTKMLLGLSSPFSRRMSSTVLRKRSAMAASESPGSTR